jgi:hypothetical protein
MLMDVDGSHLPGLAIIGSRQARRVSVGEDQGVTERKISVIQDDGGIKVLCTTS